MWICFALSLVLAVITVRCISNYGHKSHLHQSKSYSNIFSITANIISVLLSVSVNTQPRSAPLRLFFFSWVCYSVAVSTLFQVYLTTFLIEPGYKEPIRSVQEMLESENTSFSLECTKDTLATFQILFTQQLSKKIQRKIQTFVNRCLRYILRIWWPNIISNKDLWKATGQEDINLERWT